jgi:hypothetical protein
MSWQIDQRTVQSSTMRSNGSLQIGFVPLLRSSALKFTAKFTMNYSGAFPIILSFQLIRSNEIDRLWQN